MNENELMKMLQERAPKDIENEKKSILAGHRNRDEIADLVSFVNGILQDNLIHTRINNRQIRFYNDFIGNIAFPIKDKALSKIIFDASFPPPTLGSYYHFTGVEAAIQIILSQKLRLSNLRKRFMDEEYTLFYSDHGMDGYKTGGTVFGIDCSEKSIMSEIFFLSLSGLGVDYAGQSKWLDFGENGSGFRIEFDVNAKHNDFREVYYSTKRVKNCIPLLKDLFVKINEKYGIPFNFSYSSKIGAFYIKGRYQNEGEYRFLIKRTSDDYGAYYLEPTITDEKEKIGYIEIPLISEFADFRIVSVQPGYCCSDEDIEKLKTVILTTDPNIIVYERALIEYV